jgi:hypothetical protein
MTFPDAETALQYAREASRRYQAAYVVWWSWRGRLKQLETVRPTRGGAA